MVKKRLPFHDFKSKLAELQQQVLSRVRAGKNTAEPAEEIRQLREQNTKESNTNR